MKLNLLLFFLVATLFAKNVQKCEILQPDGTKSQVKTVNIKNDKSRENMENWLDAKFGLQPYRANYILPFAVADQKYESSQPNINYDSKEAELQVSLKLKLGDNLFGLHEKYYVSYTHRAFWQIYINSSPFRESLYNPEAFVIFPISDNKSILQMRSFKVDIAHMSNGQPNTTGTSFSNGYSPGNLSKSINYFYYTLRLQHDTLLTDLTLITPFPGSDNLSDNPDLMHYLGYTKVKFTYFYNEHMFTLMARGNIDSFKGAVEATYSYPLPHNSYLYMKLFSGYVESLIDYNKNITKFSIGFSFSR